MSLPAHLRLAAACLLLTATALHALTVAEFRALPDRLPVVRQSLGVRSAQALSEREVEVVIGLSVTDAAGNPGSYRVVSETDPAYAYEKFVAPLTATVERQPEAEGVKGAAFPSFARTVVRLTLPSPLQPETRYSIVAQGVGQVMVTATRTAADLIYKGTESIPAPDADVHQAVIGLRAVTPVGNGILQLDFGPGYAPAAGKNLSAYSVTVNGKPATVKNLGRISRVDAYLPTGWPFPAIPAHELFLEIEPAFQDGDAIHIEVQPTVTAGLRTADLLFNQGKSFSSSLKVNQVGYLTDSPVKMAYLGRWLGSFPEAVAAGKAADSAQDAFWQALATGDTAAPSAVSPALLFSMPPPFSVCNEEDGSPVFTATSVLVHASGQMDEGPGEVDHSGENVYQLDFTAFQTPGRYFISVPGVGRSVPFSIGPDVYAEAFRVQGSGVFIQRCGIELGPPYTPWRRIACHNKGITPTTLERSVGEGAAFKTLPDHVDYSNLASAPRAPAIQALDRDPALLAYWPLDGDFNDASGHGRNLIPRGDGQRFDTVRELMPGANQALGPTRVDQANGATAPELPLSAEQGFTCSLWVRLEGGIKFDGTLIGHATNDINIPRAQITATWGVLRGAVGRRGELADIGRLSDGKWHHVALVSHPSSGVKVFVDGTPTASGTLGPGEFDGGEFVVGALGGEEAAGKFLDEVRVYGRPLQPTEIRALATRWGDIAISIPTYGGHHDAGDYNPRSHLDVAQTLMVAYELAPAKFADGQLNIPEQVNGLPDILDEAYWALRLWLDLQEADGGVRGGTESNGDPNFIDTVDRDRLGDYAFAKDAASSFELAGALAQASRLWASLGRDAEAKEFLERARRAYAWAMAHPPAKVESPAQYAGQFLSPKAYASAELLHTTGEAAFNEDFRAACVWAKKPDADTDIYRLYDQQAAAWAYAQCPAGVVDAALQKAATDAIIRKADVFIQYSSEMAYGFIRHPWAPISWGTGAYENWLEPLLWADKLTGDPKYRQWIIRTCDNTLGANPLGLSWISGLGTKTIRAPLHNSRYGNSGEVVDGLHCQGPNQRGEGYRVTEVAYPALRENFAPLYTFVDTHFAIAMNEGLTKSMAKSMAVFGLLQPDKTK